MASTEDIKNALQRAANTVAAKPAVGQRVYVSTAMVGNGLACHVQEKDHVLIADLPPSMGGENSGPTPSALFRAALSSCLAMGVKMWAARNDITVERVEVRVETDVDARGQLGVADCVAPGFEKLRAQIRVVSAADPDRVAEIVETSLRLSPLMDALRQPLTIATELSVDAGDPGDR